MDKLKLFEMFAGYGGASFALTKAGINFECVGYSEIDKFAIQCYDQNHPGIKNYGDCSEINPDKLPDFDLLTAGFPCQDVSIAGNRDLSKGRTLLVNHVFRIAKVKQPEYMLLENVKGLLSTPLWKSIKYTLHKLGYGLAYKVLNSKDYGIPQNRERIWIVCKKGGFDFNEFSFPDKEKFNLKLFDLLEKKVDEKYYLTEKQIRFLIKTTEKSRRKGNQFSCNFNDVVSSCIDTRQGAVRNQGETYILDRKLKRKKNKDVASCLTGGGNSGGNHSDMDLIVCDYKCDEYLRVRNDGNSPCIGTMERGGLCRTPLVYAIKGDLFSRENPERQNGISDENMFTLRNAVTHGVYINKTIRRLTPKECFRLMGFLNDEINLSGLSDTQKYKLAGNGWEIQTVSKIFKKLFKNKK